MIDFEGKLFFTLSFLVLNTIEWLLGTEIYQK